MNIDKVLARMRQDQEELTIAIRVFDRLTGNHHHRAGLHEITRAMTDAAQRANGNGQSAYMQKKAAGKLPATRRRPLPEVEPIPGLQLADKPLTEAIVTVLGHVKKPIDGRTLTAYLNAAGRQNDSRGIGVVTSQMAKRRTIRRNAQGLLSPR